MEILKAVLPVIVTLIAGMIFRKKKIISPDGIEGLQSLVVNLTLPATLFGSFYKTSVTADRIVFPLTMFLAVSLGVLCGKLISRLFGRKDRYLPFMLSGYEAGMLGFALMAILVGSSNITTFAMLDIGQDLAICTVYITMLKAVNGERQTAGTALKGALGNPGLVAILAGAVLGFSGIGEKIASSPAGPVVDRLFDFIAAPTAVAILIVIGFRMNFRGLAWSRVLKACAVRIVEQGIFAAVILAVYRLLGGVFSELLTVQSVLLMMILPPPFILPLYIDGEDDRSFYSSALSVYTVFTVVCFTVLVAVTL